MSNNLLASDSRHHIAQLPPLSLYIHIPWCIRKCPYCDFNSHAAPAQLPEQTYVATLLQDLQQQLHALPKRPLHSVFIGGGTPSLLSAQAIQQLLDGLRALDVWHSDIEVTLEANPGSFEQEKFYAYRKAGINRLSIGIQSFNDQHLQRLGRVHSANEAQQAVHIARQAGFDNINLDLMHGLPDQQPHEALADLWRAIELQPEHLSWYQLTIEPNTKFWSTPPTLPDDDLLWQIQLDGQQLLAKHGYAQYEISAYAKTGRQAQHNLNYWKFGDYLGIGAGAHGKITHIDGRIQRYWKTRQPADYLRSPQQAGEQILSQAELPFEFLINALRLLQGTPADLFSQRTGLPLSRLQPAWQNAIARGLMPDNRHQLVASEKGLLFLNDLLQSFLPEDV